MKVFYDAVKIFKGAEQDAFGYKQDVFEICLS